MKCPQCGSEGFFPEKGCHACGYMGMPLEGNPAGAAVPAGIDGTSMGEASPGYTDESPQAEAITEEPSTDNPDGGASDEASEMSFSELNRMLEALGVDPLTEMDAPGVTAIPEDVHPGTADLADESHAPAVSPELSELIPSSPSIAAQARENPVMPTPSTSRLADARHTAGPVDTLLSYARDVAGWIGTQPRRLTRLVKTRLAAMHGRKSASIVGASVADKPETAVESDEAIVPETAVEADDVIVPETAVEADDVIVPETAVEADDVIALEPAMEAAAPHIPETENDAPTSDRQSTSGEESRGTKRAKRTFSIPAGLRQALFWGGVPLLALLLVLATVWSVIRYRDRLLHPVPEEAAPVHGFQYVPWSPPADPTVDAVEIIGE